MIDILSPWVGFVLYLFLFIMLLIFRILIEKEKE